MADAATLIHGYIATWNEKDPERRRALLADTFTDDADYLDPLMQGEGRDAIDALIAAVQEKYAGYHFELATAPDAHHDRVRFSWHLFGTGAATPVATGHDFGLLADDGRLRSVTGFLELPAH